MSLVPKKTARMKVVVSFLTAIALFLSSSPVLAAVASICCMKKQVPCNMTAKMGHSKNHVCPLAKKMLASNENAPAEGELAHHSSDPVSCCKKYCDHPIVEMAKSKQLVNKKTDASSAVKFIRVQVAVLLMQTEETSSYHIESRPLLFNSQPLYSLNSAYLI